MEEKQKRKTVREELADKFVGILESDKPLQWVKEWSTGGYSAPYNGQSGRKYNGVNRFVLMFQAMDKGWTDPRYYTFHQIDKLEGCHVRAGEKATPIEYWYVYDMKEKRGLTFSEYERLRKENPERKDSEFRISTRSMYVFNAAQVEGLEPLKQEERHLEEDRLAEDAVHTMSETMEVPLVYGGDEAYYKPATDTIHLPPKEAFFTTAAYVSTALHELAHATSAPSRLDRPIAGYLEDPDKYALEELRAEIASTFASGELSVDIPDEVTQNHLAYVSSWLSQIKEDPNVLFTAIKDADKIADYLIDKGRVEELREKLEIEAKMPKKINGVSYEIWQLKDTPENKALLFSDYAYASLFRLTESRYDKIYEAQAGEDDYTLDRIFCKFNFMHPEDFQGHSLSASDVVVLNIDGTKTAWFVDRIGFKEVPGFCQTHDQVEKRGRAR